ncbi:hypothetical protein [Clostridium sp. CF012]|uniref:hypothetical protein n=1 Tax=Clostridium sp. CF012 TaxID=2843319 RepID=UPI001C0DDFDE|nr:hypothetical protein [Clostridium sp. CF012]MBU3146923.1 hypothetical protein [Clostridium sp. CF012]
MSKRTTNLSLYKLDSTDDANTFNIDLVLNENWDKIDLDSKSKGNAISSIAGEGRTTETVKGNSDKIAVLNGTGAIKEKANKEDLNTLSNSVTSSLADNSKQVPHLGTTTKVVILIA